MLEMYEMNLKESLFSEQLDAELWDITVGDLLRDIAGTYPCSEAVVEVDENGDRALCLTYQEVLDTSERLAVALGTRFFRGEKIAVWAPNISQWIILEYACALAGLVMGQNRSFGKPRCARGILDLRRVRWRYVWQLISFTRPSIQGVTVEKIGHFFYNRISLNRFVRNLTHRISTAVVN